MTVETVDLDGLPVTKSGPYLGNGVTSVFDYDFQIQTSAELKVTRQNADLTETELVLTTDYTVAGVGVDAGGQVTLVAPATALPTGAQMVIRYHGAYNQSADYSSQGGVDLGALETSLDALMMHLRELREAADRAVSVDAFGTVDVAALRSNISALALIEAQIVIVASNIATVTTVAAVAADVTTVAGISTDVTTVAGDTAGIAAIVANLVAVQNAAANAIAAAASAVASDVSAVAAGASQGAAAASAAAALASQVAALASELAAAISAAAAANRVLKTSDTGSAAIPTGTEAQRDVSPSTGYLRFNSTVSSFEGYNGTAWGSIGGGATGSAGDQVFVQNDQTVTADYTVPADKNAMTTGPIQINSGVSVTVSAGARWVVI